MKSEKVAVKQLGKKAATHSGIAHNWWVNVGVSSQMWEGMITLLSLSHVPMAAHAMQSSDGW